MLNLVTGLVRNYKFYTIVVPCAYSAQLYSVTLVPLGFHCPFVGLSVFHKTETGDLNLFYEGRLYGAGGAVGPWII